MREKVGLIEPDKDARAQLLRELAGGGFHAEPYENLSEFLMFRGKTGYTVLVADARVDALSVREGLALHGEWEAVIAFAEQPMPQRIVQFIRGGGYDYLPLPLDMAALARSVGLLAQGGTPYAAARQRAADARLRLQALSPREAEVLGCMAQGRSNKTIGIDLGISPRTVEIHRANMLAKLGANSSTEALRMFYEDALLNGAEAVPGG